MVYGRAHCQIALLLTGAPACYLSQAAWGQLDLMARAQPIERILERGAAPPALARILEMVVDIKAFGREQGLAISSSYSSYAELDRDAAVWVVTASAPLAFEPKTWSFPVVGSFPYLGWFDRRDALRFADDLAREGYDVHVRGASAYSTLGWFHDPVLSTMLTRGASVTGDLVNTVLHESVHATVHLDGQGTFNESVAMFVADRLSPDYLRRRFGDGSFELRAYLAEEARRARRADAFMDAYRRLAAVYASDRSALDKLIEKHRILLALETAVDVRVALNNATLEGFRTYRAGQDELAALLAGCEHDWRRFLAAAARVDATWFDEEQQDDIAPVLRRLLGSGCP